MARREKRDAAIEAGPSCVLATTRRAARLLTQLYDAHLREHGIEAAQFALLMTIDAWPEKGHAALGRALGMDKTTLSRNLKLLHARGWVESVAGTDARTREVMLTAEGRERLMAAEPAWRRAQAEVRAAMSDREWYAMWDALRALTGAATGAAAEKR